MLNARYNSELAGYTPYRYNNITDDNHAYLPWVQTGPASEGWVRIRDVGGAGASGTVTYFNSSGSQVASENFTISANATWDHDANWLGLDGWYSAVIYSNQPVAATFELNDSASSFFRTAAYAGMVDGSDKVYLPLTMNNNSGWYTELSVQNLGSVATTVQVKFVGSGQQLSNSVQPRGFWKTGYGYGNTVDAAYITSSDGRAPIAVAVKERTSDDKSIMFYNATNSEETRATARSPLVMANNGGWWTAMRVQNAGSRNATVTVTYYRYDNAGTWSKTYSDIAPDTARTAHPNDVPLPTPFLGSAVADNLWGTGQPLAGMSNEVSGTMAMSWELGTIGAKTLYLPTVWKRSEFWGNITVQNISGAAATVYVDYYNKNGTLNSSVGPYTINPGYMKYSTPPQDFDGSARVRADQRVLAHFNALVNSKAGDIGKAYIAPMPRVDEIAP